MGCNQHINFRNYEGFSRMLINFLSFCFYGLLVTEMIFLTIKVYSYDVENCIFDGIDNDLKIKNTTLLINIRQLCWTRGYFKDEYFQKMEQVSRGQFKFEFKKASDSRSKTERIIRFEKTEVNFNRQIVILHYCLFLILLLLRYVKKKCDLMNPIIQQLRQRSLLHYCDFDRDAIKNSIKILIEKSRTFFFAICLIKLVYFSLSFGLIWSTKFLLYGQYPIDLFDWMDLVLFPEITQTQERENDIIFTDSTFQNYLNIVFMFLWKVYLVELIIFILLVIIRLIQYLIPSFRNKSILTFSPNINVDVLNSLNYSIGSYYILHKIARNIEPFYFTVLFEDTFFIKNQSFDDKSEEDKLQAVTIDEHYCNGSNPNYTENPQDEQNSNQIEKEQLYLNKPLKACIELKKNYQNKFKTNFEDHDKLIKNDNEPNLILKESNLDLAKYVDQNDPTNTKNDNQINDQIDRQTSTNPNDYKIPMNVEQSAYLQKFNENQNYQNQQNVCKNKQNNNKSFGFYKNQFDVLSENQVQPNNTNLNENQVDSSNQYRNQPDNSNLNENQLDSSNQYRNQPDNSNLNENQLDLGNLNQVQPDNINSTDNQHQLADKFDNKLNFHQNDLVD